ncbi:YiiX/YebB-like N1pC/P60 family cysteine hydrolase [Bacteroides pyogenes]|uniref:YiiX/YebB-like N1pC/P60 family cysteine hydrolase n=1 Tax=Bacteroides pyogenes TaxID=310300 RepID=UPI001BA9C571|nr:YiiX/YebB-like N1pC/P60 family cysteine hydrolase [Bacteroides pyogenes]MBR8706107.1 hypothetical protein [Bacteroides pyogenes]
MDRGFLIKYGYFLFIIGCLFSCHELPCDCSVSEELLHEGDIVFRRGTGMASRMVLGLDRKGRYSHVGIVVRHRDRWKVVHAVPGEPDETGDEDFVKMEELGDFFAPDKAVSGALMRFRADSILACKAALKAIEIYNRHTPFDHSYNLKDTSKMYCTELIWFVYRWPGMDGMKQPDVELNIPGLSGTYLFPSDVAALDGLVVITNY